MKKFLSIIGITLAAVGCYSVSITPSPRPNPDVITVQSFWNHLTPGSVASVGVLPVTAPDYAAALATPGTNVFYTTNAIMLENSTNFTPVLNGTVLTFQCDFTLTNVPDGLLFVCATKQDGGTLKVSDGNAEATNWVVHVNPNSGTMVTK